MSADVTVDARRMQNTPGDSPLRLCFHWANHAPREVPLLNGEWWFIAIDTPEVAEAFRPRRGDGRAGAAMSRSEPSARSRPARASQRGTAALRYAALGWSVLPLHTPDREGPL